MSILKRSLIEMLAIFFFSIAICFANQGVNKFNEQTLKECYSWLTPAIGDWYDCDGNLIMSIKVGSINNCQIIKGFDFAGGYPRGGIFRILEANGYRDIRLDMEGDKGSIHQLLIVDKKQVLYRTTKPQYFESVSGIYLGMPMKEVYKIFGVPSNRNDSESFLNPDFHRLDYDKVGLTLFFDGDAVVQILLKKNSTCHFDRTGFNCNDSFKSYYDAYKMKKIPFVDGDINSGLIAIGDGEYMFFSKDGIELTIFDN